LPDDYAALLAHERALVAARERIATLDQRFRQSVSQAGSSPAIEVLHGARSVQRRFYEVQQSAPSQVLGTEGPPYIAPDTTDETVVLLLKAGMSYRILYDRRALDLPGRPYGEVLDVSDGRRVRVGVVPTKLVLTDEPVGFLPLHGDPDGPPAAIVVRDPTLLTALRALFEIYWERAVPISVRPGSASTDDELLPLLVAGLTDPEIAAKLGWSHRTVRRRVRDMMTRLDAQTRFQAGYAAARRGWLGHDSN
jgi:DNA-binding CsgD family transcriptional regulator